MACSANSGTTASYNIYAGPMRNIAGSDGNDHQHDSNHDPHDHRHGRVSNCLYGIDDGVVVVHRAGLVTLVSVEMESE